MINSGGDANCITHVFSEPAAVQCCGHFDGSLLVTLGWCWKLLPEWFPWFSAPLGPSHYRSAAVSHQSLLPSVQNFPVSALIQHHWNHWFLKHVESVFCKEPYILLENYRKSLFVDQEVNERVSELSAGDQRHRDLGAYPQCTGPDDGDPADLSPVEGQQQPLHQTEPPDLLTAVWPPGRIPAEPGGTQTAKHALASPRHMTPDVRAGIVRFF